MCSVNADTTSATMSSAATEMLHDTLLLFMFALIANQAAAWARLMDLPLATTPVSVRWLGENKTVAPYYVAPVIVWLALVVYGQPHAIYGALAIGWGAVLGDHLKSFIKRRLGYPPGAPWLPDRFDFALGAGLAVWATSPWVTWKHVLLMVVFAIPTHYAGNYLSHRFGLRSTPH